MASPTRLSELLTRTSADMSCYAGGARGALWASQVAPGNENALMLRVYGTKGGLVWRQENPNQLFWSPLNEPTRGT